jgi:hypothetical protein
MLVDGVFVRVRSITFVASSLFKQNITQGHILLMWPGWHANTYLSDMNTIQHLDTATALFQTVVIYGKVVFVIKA